MTAPAHRLRHTAFATSAAPVYDRPVAPERPTRPPLSVVPPGMRPGRRPARRAPKTPFVMLLLLLMGGGLLGLLLLNTALTEDAFRLHKLQQESKALAEHEQALSLKVDELSAPSALAARAAEFGMVPGSAPRYLPVDMPIPPGARVIGAEPGAATVLVVLPGQPVQPAPPDPAGAGTGTSPKPEEGTSTSADTVLAASEGTSAATGTSAVTEATGTSAVTEATGTSAVTEATGTSVGPAQ